MRIFQYIAVIVLLGISYGVSADSEPRCPCFNAMFPAGVCEVALNNGGECMTNIESDWPQLYCRSENAGQNRFRFEAQDLYGRCMVTTCNKNNCMGIVIKDEISTAEFEACREEIETASALLEECIQYP